MAAIISLLIIIALSIIVVRIGAVALELTGLSAEIASFQSQSAFSGVGFTTTESEAIVTHPVRRKIIRTLILMGSAGVTSSIATLVLAFMGQTQEGFIIRILVLSGGVIALALFAKSKYIYRVMKIVIIKILGSLTSLRIFDYEQLFGFAEGYTIARIPVKADCCLTARPIKDLKQELDGILILGIYRKTEKSVKFIGAPDGDTFIHIGDDLICYAKEEAINRNLL